MEEFCKLQKLKLHTPCYLTGTPRRSSTNEQINPYYVVQSALLHITNHTKAWLGEPKLLEEHFSGQNNLAQCHFEQVLSTIVIQGT